MCGLQLAPFCCFPAVPLSRNGPIHRENGRGPWGVVSERVLRINIEYVHNNPVNRGLVSKAGQWLWSSWRHYHLRDDSV